MHVEKVVMIKAAEYEDLPRHIVAELLDWSKLRYGVKLVSAETGKEITDMDEAVGALMTPLRKALNLSA